MKRIAWIAVCSLAVAACGHGATAETPEAEKPGGFAGALLGGAPGEKADEPVAESPRTSPPASSEVRDAERGRAATPQAPGGFGGGALGDIPKAATGSSVPGGMSGGTWRGAAPGVLSTSASGKVTSRGATSTAAGFGIYAGTTPTRDKKGRTFRLHDIATGGATYGPFEMRDGEIVRIGEKGYRLEIVEAEKTAAQKDLEEELRAKTLSVRFESAQIGGVIDYISKQGDVNIVVTRRVQEEINPEISLSLKNVPVYDAIRYITEVVDLRFRIDDHAVFISD